MPAFRHTFFHGHLFANSDTLRLPINKTMADGVRTSDPCVMVIFGATGDLMKRKLLPALYNLAKDDFLPHTFAIIGVGRQEMSNEEFQKMTVANLKEFIPGGPDKDIVKWFEERVYYTGGDFDDDKKLFS